MEEDRFALGMMFLSIFGIKKKELQNYLECLRGEVEFTNCQDDLVEILLERNMLMINIKDKGTFIKKFVKFYVSRFFQRDKNRNTVKIL